MFTAKIIQLETVDHSSRSLQGSKEDFLKCEIKHSILLEIG
jgi:hypothetical protein